MEKHELESAIAAGIFWGILSVFAALFVLWLFSPLLIPLAFAAQIYAIDRWKQILSLLGVGIGSMALLWILWVSITPLLAKSAVGRWFKNRLYPRSTVRDRRPILFVIGILLFGAFSLFAFASRTMTRDFEVSDVAFLTGWLGTSVACFYFALRKPK